MKMVIIFFPPILVKFRNARGPRLALVPGRAIGQVQHTGQGYSGVTLDGCLQGIISAKGLGLDVDLNGRRADGGNRPDADGGQLSMYPA